MIIHSSFQILFVIAERSTGPISVSLKAGFLKDFREKAEPQTEKALTSFFLFSSGASVCNGCLESWESSRSHEVIRMTTKSLYAKDGRVEGMKDPGF